MLPRRVGLSFSIHGDSLDPGQQIGFSLLELELLELELLELELLGG